jgi:hypothetical protein
MDCLQTKCILFAQNIQTKCRLTPYFACILIANLAHSHQLVVGPERPAVDELCSVEVPVPNIKSAEDLDLRPLVTAPASLDTRTLLHAPHPPPILIRGELIVHSVGYRQPEPSKPVGTAKVVQEVGQFGPKVLENRMLRDVGAVFIGGRNRFAQGGESIEIAMIITTMQGMSHPVKRLCPPSDIALECIGQTTLGLPTSRPVEAGMLPARIRPFAAT